MIPKIQGYNAYNNSYPTFGSAVVAKGVKITVKHRKENISENVVNKFFSNLKEVFFEMFPKLDPEYKKLENAKQSFTLPVTVNYGYGHKENGKYIAKYNNPNAKELYNLAKQETDIYKKAELYEQMGDCNIINIEASKQTDKFFESQLK